MTLFCFVDLVKSPSVFVDPEIAFEHWGLPTTVQSFGDSEALEKEFRLAEAPWRIGDPCKMSSSKAFPAVHCQERYGKGGMGRF